MVRLLCCFFFGCCSKPQDKDITVRKYILKQVKKNKSIDEVDKKIETKFGKDAILYSELDYWYYRFYNGGRDVEYDRSQDPKPVELSDLPDAMKMKIIAKMDFEDRPNLRKVSKFFQTNAYHDIKYLGVDRFKPKTMDVCSFLIPKGSITLPLQEAEKELKAILNTSGLQLKLFRIQFEPIQVNELLREAVTEYKADLESFFNSLNSPIQSEIFDLEACDVKDLLTFLPFLKPGMLEHIVYMNFWNGSEDCIDTFMKLNEIEQWKQAIKATLIVETYDPIISVPVDYFLHFKLISIWTVSDLTDGQPFKWIKELITKSPALEVFHVICPINFLDFCEFLGADIEVLWENQTDGVAIWITSATSKIPERVFKIGRHPKRVEHMWINRTDCVFNGEWCREF